MADPATAAIVGSMLVSGGAQVYGANQANQTNQSNFNAQQQQQNLINNQAFSMMGQGTNPYAQAIQNMLGQMRPPGSPAANVGQLPAPAGTGGFYPGNANPQITQGPAGGPGGPPTLPQTMFAGGSATFNEAGGQSLRAGSRFDNDREEVVNEGGPGGGVTGGGGGVIPGNIGPNIPPAGPGFPGMSPQAPIATPQMYQYQPMDAPTFNPATLGQAPQIGPMNQINIQDLLTPQIGQVPQAGGPGQVSAGQVTGTQGMNAGQDALMQMMNRDIGAPRDQFLGNQLQQIGMGDSQFDNSALFGALAPLDKQLIDEQVSDLYGSKGSFGQKFGSQTRSQETDLRGQFAQNIAARNAGIQQQSFEQAQGRRMQALGQIGGQEQFFGQMPFQNAALQLQAAQGAGQLGQGAQGLNLQASLANAANQLQAGTTNAQLGLQNNQFNAGNSLQAMLQQAQLGLAAGQGNQQMQFGAQQANIGNALQAALANQQMQGQYGMGNANILNQAGQFNVGNMMAQNQFNTGQGNLYNQQVLQMLGLGQNYQQGQQGLNAQLLGIMAGVPVAQQMPSQLPGAIGDAASMGMMVPFLLQALGGGGAPSTGFSQYGQSAYGGGMFR